MMLFELITKKEAIKTIQRVLLDKIEKDPLAIDTLKELDGLIENNASIGQSSITYKVFNVCSTENLRLIRDLYSSLGYKITLSNRQYYIEIL